jgi:hypothetical protein
MSAAAVDVTTLRTSVETMGGGAPAAMSEQDDAGSPSWQELHRARELARRVSRDRQRTMARGFDD